MKSGCAKTEQTPTRSIALPVLPPAEKSDIRKSKTSAWRAAVLVTVNLLMIAHFVQWRLTGQTVSPIEPSETMYTLQNGAINAGVIFFTLAIVATLVFGRFVCGWGCHILALQDLCAWLLKKIGLKPRPFRSRLLIFVPLVAALYMFVLPTLLRAIAAPRNEALIPPFTNHLITSDFWSTFPPLAVAVPFLLICGFATVYFLGSKGFCTYACPYGGFFALTDRFSPGRIRVNDACNECGHCTATCTSNVLVHLEVKQHGMVVDPGCMKCMDCVSVCPNDALYFGFGKPAVAALSTKTRKNYSLSWPEEIFAALVFIASFLAVWDVYQLVPMLMALGIAAVTSFVSIKSLKLLRSPDSSFYSYSLRSSGTLRPAGVVFICFAGAWLALAAHSGWVRYQERVGASAFQSVQIPDELALAQADPKAWLTAADRSNISAAKLHFTAAEKFGLFTNSEELPKLAWLEFLSGNASRSTELLSVAATYEKDQAQALSLYYRGAILNRLKRSEEALASLDRSLAISPDLILAREERGESLWLLGCRDEAVAAWQDAVNQNPQLTLANYFLAGAALAGQDSRSADLEKIADLSAPDDAYFQYMLGLRLENVGMRQLAEKRFQRAGQLDPALRARRNLDLLNRF